MATKFLDQTGLAYLWSKLKAALATKKDKGAIHSYTTAANAAKNWFRLANATTHQTDAMTPLHLQFILRADSTAGVDYHQQWFVDLQVAGRTSGLRILGNTTAPFSQARVLYENTAANVSTSIRPAVDIYLHYVLAQGTTITIEEIYNSGWAFVADGQLAASTVPSGYESRAAGVNGNGVDQCNLAAQSNYSRINYSNISANTTLAVNDTYAKRVLNCTGTITLTIPTGNANYAWFWIKNNGTGVVTLHPASTSVYFDNVSEDITLQPKEFILLACQSSGHYSIVGDGRWMTGKAASSHGTHVTYSTTAPAANGTASAGSANNVSRGDHVHPTDTTRLAKAGDTATGLIRFSAGITGINKANAVEDANTLYAPVVGAKQIYYTETDGGTKLTNVPAAVSTLLESHTVRLINPTSDWEVSQILYNKTGIHYRRGNQTGWSAWCKFALMENVTSTFTWESGEEPARFYAYRIGRLVHMAFQGPVKTHDPLTTLGTTTLDIAQTFIPFVKGYGSTSGTAFGVIQFMDTGTIRLTFISSTTVAGRIFFNGSLLLSERAD